MCSRTLIGVLFPNTVQWGRSVTHLWPVATFSKCLCLAKGEWFIWFYFLPWNFVRQFDTSEKCNQGGTSILEPLCIASWSWLLGTLAGPWALPTPGTTGTPARVGQARQSSAHSTSGDTFDIVVWTVCLGIIRRPWGPGRCARAGGCPEDLALMLVPGPQVAAWLQVQGRNARERVWF